MQVKYKGIYSSPPPLPLSSLQGRFSKSSKFEEKS